MFLEHLRRNISNTNDLYAVLLMLAVNERNKKVLAERGCSALDSYLSQVSILLWPRFE